MKSNRVKISLLSRPVDILIVVLYSYFLCSCIFIETRYCAAPLNEDDEDALMKATYEYAIQYNPLFLTRPEWLRAATCLSAYGLSVGYVVGIIAFLGAIDSLRVPLLMFCSFKLNSIFLYYFLEFFGSMPVPDPVMFLAPEFPYVLGLVLVLFRLRNDHPFSRV